METKRFATYEEFWPFYVREHSDRICRVLHFTGTTLALFALVLGVIGSWKWFLAAPLCGYAFAWVGHFFFEKNRPATFSYPLWSLRADFRMYRYMWTGRMSDEIKMAH